MNIPYTVLGGYLGAGKTTLLNKLLNEQSGERIALLINDFGSINIDAALIESQSDQQINLANGCVCCTLSDGFWESLDRLYALDPPPQHIVVEASGVADVNKLAQFGHTGQFRLNGVIVLADAEQIVRLSKDKYVGPTVLRQLDAADLIVLNKIDLVSEQTREAVEGWLKARFPNVPVVPTKYGAIASTLIAGVERIDHATSSGAAHAHFASWAFESQALVSANGAEAFMQSLGADVIRAKGLIVTSNGTLELQVVGSRKALTPTAIHSHTHTQLIAIGIEGELDTETLDEAAAEYLADAPR